ncbi:MAG: hypothetical protein B6245_07500 [Desulfobacteraceae bacterium 4572_88]|nr:MAG: hypothetical protein B6245_07500 [Desulfobacteraceae bacterium 4572_88]
MYAQFRDRAGNTANALALTEMVEDMPDQHTITAIAGENGTIIPSGEVSVYSGEDMRFTLTPDNGYEVDRVLANGQPVTSDGNICTLRDVSANGSVSVTFRPESVVSYRIDSDM